MKTYPSSLRAVALFDFFQKYQHLSRSIFWQDLCQPFSYIFHFTQVILQWNDFHTHINLQTELALFTGVFNIIDKNKIWKKLVFIIREALKPVASRSHEFFVLCNLTGEGLSYEYEITILILGMYMILINRLYYIQCTYSYYNACFVIFCKL